MLGSLIAGVIVNKNDALPLYKNEIVQIFLLIALVQIVFVVYTVSYSQGNASALDGFARKPNRRV